MRLLKQASLVILVIFLRSHTIHSKEIRLGAMIPWTGTWPGGPRMASAIIIAIDEVKKRNILPGYNITYLWRDTKCQAGPTLNAVADFCSSKPRVDAFIGSACSIGCVPSAHLAAHWNIPICSYGCNDDTLSDKNTYPTFARTVSSISKATGVIFVHLMQRYKWDRVAMLATTETMYAQVAIGAKEVIETEGKDGKSEYKVSYFQSFTPSVMTDSRYKMMLKSARERAHGECTIRVYTL